MIASMQGLTVVLCVALAVLMGRLADRPPKRSKRSKRSKR